MRNSNLKKTQKIKKSKSTIFKNQISNKGPWTEEEDKNLILLVEKYGPEKWSYISSFLPERIGKQCRERWFNHLCPTVNKTSWSKEEEIILYLMHKKYGNKWSLLCKFLPGRTDNTIKNHWNSTMKKKIGNIESEYNLKIKGKNEKEIEEVDKEILDKCLEIVKKENEKFFEEKKKNYEKFKNTDVENKQSIGKLKKILLFRTHSKKTKKRGRKRKNFILKNNNNSLLENKNNIIMNNIVNNHNISLNESSNNNSNNNLINHNIINESNNDYYFDNKIFKKNDNKTPILNTIKFKSKKTNLSTPIKDFNTTAFNSHIINKSNDNEIINKNTIEKSAFNKQLISTFNENPISFSNIKTQLLFTSSIKKPVKIISEDNNYLNDDKNIPSYLNNENITPNKSMESLKFEIFKTSIPYKTPFTSNKKDFNLNEGFTPYKNNLNTPFKINNVNLDKMFFSSFKQDVDTPAK